MKSKVETELKTTSTLKKKDKLVKNIKAKFGEGVGEEEEDDDEEDEEEEWEQGQEPITLIQGMGEDRDEEEVEGVEEEEVKEAPAQIQQKKGQGTACGKDKGK